LDLKGEIKNGFFQKIHKLFICKPLPEATSGNVFSGKVDKVSMGISNGFFFGGNGKS
jgi:hypothetical protein